MEINIQPFDIGYDILTIIIVKKILAIRQNCRLQYHDLRCCFGMRISRCQSDALSEAMLTIMEVVDHLLNPSRHVHDYWLGRSPEKSSSTILSC